MYWRWRFAIERWVCRRTGGLVASYALLTVILAATTVGALHTLGAAFRDDPRAGALLSIRDDARWPAAPAVERPVVEIAAPTRVVALEPPTVSPEPVAPPTPPASPSVEKDDGARPWFSGNAKTYRTVCVRLCDGYFFPISFSTTRDGFDEDEAICRSRCATPARLFVFENPGGSAETMRDRKGRRYQSLETAFAFRAKFDAACTCKGQPWEKASAERHHVYALQDRKRTGDKQAAAELKQLRKDIAGRPSVTEEGRAEVATVALVKALEPARRKRSTRRGTYGSRRMALAAAQRRPKNGWPAAMGAGVRPKPSARRARQNESPVGSVLGSLFGGF